MAQTVVLRKHINLARSGFLTSLMGRVYVAKLDFVYLRVCCYGIIGPYKCGTNTDVVIFIDSLLQNHDFKSNEKETAHNGYMHPCCNTAKNVSTQLRDLDERIRTRQGTVNQLLKS